MLYRGAVPKWSDVNQRGWGHQERRDLPAESGEGNEVRTLLLKLPVLSPLPPSRTFPNTV